MIVVVGNPIGSAADPRTPHGPAVRTAVAAARAGAQVQLIGRVGEDPEGDALLLTLAREGVGHVAVLRDPARRTPVAAVDQPDEDVLADTTPDGHGTTSSDPPTDRPTLDAADVDLGLRYLTEYGVLVVAEPLPADVVAVATEAAAYSGARLVVVAATATVGMDGAVVLEAPDSDPDGAFAQLVGTYAAALDAGADPETAFNDTVAQLGWSRPED